MNKIILSIGVMLALLATTSCKDLLVESPKSSYDSGLLFSTVAGADLALNGAFGLLSSLDHYGQTEIAMAGSDDMYYSSSTTNNVPDNGERDLALYRTTSSNTSLEKLWTLKYQIVNHTNHIIYQVQQMPEYSDKNKRLLQIKGEAHFLRAMMGFDIARYWGDAPFKTEYTAVIGDAFQDKISREEILDKVIADLEVAAQLLPWATATHNPERPSKGAAHALAMRAYLHKAGYHLPSTAVAGSELVRPDEETRRRYYTKITEKFEEFKIGGGTFHELVVNDYEKLWKGYSSKKEFNPSESLYEIAFYSPNGYPGGASAYGIYNGPNVAVGHASIAPSTNNRFFVIRTWAESYYTATDKRKDVNATKFKIDKNNNRVENAYYYPGKWRREWGTRFPAGHNNRSDVNVVYLRYADVLLMAAEAYNELGNWQKAVLLINEVRNRADAGLIDEANFDNTFKEIYLDNKPNLVIEEQGLFPIGNQQEKIRRALYFERNFELCYEGVRRYDLMRWGVIGKIIPNVKQYDKSGKVTTVYTANFVSGKSELYPIPRKEMDVNHKITANNPGY